MTRIAAICFLLLGTLAVSGCGIKPGTLESPQGEEESGFPRNYPAPDAERDDDRFREHYPY